MQRLNSWWHPEILLYRSKVVMCGPFPNSQIVAPFSQVFAAWCDGELERFPTFALHVIYGFTRKSYEKGAWWTHMSISYMSWSPNFDKEISRASGKNGINRMECSTTYTVTVTLQSLHQLCSSLPPTTHLAGSTKDLEKFHGKKLDKEMKGADCHEGKLSKVGILTTWEFFLRNSYSTSALMQNPEQEFCI